MNKTRIAFLSIASLCLVSVNIQSASRAFSGAKRSLSSLACKTAFSSRPLAAKPTSKQLLSRPEFQELIKHSNDYVQANGDALACEKNESGFVRVNIPVLKGFSQTIEKIRLNYWSPDAGVEIAPESIHDHPRYFESMIIKGGYTHAVYVPTTQEKSDLYDRFRIFKGKKGSKTFIFGGKEALQFVGNKTFKKESVVTFPKSLIHRVTHTQDKTLTINAVFKGDTDQTFYDLFLTPNGSMGDVKTKREVLVDDKATVIMGEIKNALQNFIDESNIE